MSANEKTPEKQVIVPLQVKSLDVAPKVCTAEGWKRAHEKGCSHTKQKDEE